MRIVVETLGNVKVFNDVAGPENCIKPSFVPPFAPGKIPVTFVVKSIVPLAIFEFVIAPAATTGLG